MQAFMTILADVERIYLVIDALDECSEIDKFFRFLHGIKAPDFKRLAVAVSAISAACSSFSVAYSPMAPRFWEI